jgi:hypothetical protein
MRFATSRGISYRSQSDERSRPMREYIIYRHGFHPGLQSAEHGLPEKMAVARVHADDADEACRCARHEVEIGEGQHLSAEPADEVDAHEAELNLTARAGA